MTEGIVVQNNSLQTKETGELAFQYHNEIVKTIQAINNNFLYLGKLFYEVCEKQLYITLGYNTIEEYIGSPEIGMKRSWFYQIIQIHKKFILELNCEENQLMEVGISKLSLLTRNNVSSEIHENNVSDWLSDARELSKSDLIKKIYHEEEPVEKTAPLAPGFYRIVRTTKTSFGDFEPVGMKKITVGRDEAGTIIRVN